MPVHLIRKTYAAKIPELIDEGVFKAVNKDIYHYDAGMNFLGVLGEVPNHQLNKTDVKIECIWYGKVSDPLKWDKAIKREPNILYDYNGSGKHFQNNDPRYLLPIGSTNLHLKKITFLTIESEYKFWFSRQNWLQKILLFFKTDKKKKEWAKMNTQNLNKSLANNRKNISII